MGTIYKRNNRGSWVLSWFDASGRRKTVSSRTTDHRAAERILREKEAGVALRRDGVVDPAKDRFLEAERRES